MPQARSSTFGTRLAEFYEGLHLDAQLPSGIEAMNPYKQPQTMACVRDFCTMLYNDNHERVSIWGINPGRFGGGVTGLSFTDPVVLREVCGIETHLSSQRELSAEYVWRVIEAFGGAGKQGATRFFSRFFLTALCPLGFVKQADKGAVNYNFYDDKALFEAVRPFMVETMQQQCALGIRRDVAICFGTGKLYAVFEAFNKEYHFFGKIIPLEHPRFIMQYRRKQLQHYIEKYVETLRQVEYILHI
jgi:hypothetical protein